MVKRFDYMYVKNVGARDPRFFMKGERSSKKPNCDRRAGEQQQPLHHDFYTLK